MTCIPSSAMPTSVSAVLFNWSRPELDWYTDIVLVGVVVGGEMGVVDRVRVDEGLLL